ncbi:2Fe-2S iron-sulfur cluster binding domain-containing protein [Pseudoflavonifractor sp. NSJ-25]|uniref:2Fe-2S iron-sulfur cluster binding domain-containing protein n=2 Tax=Pseudoflavonifractor hominis TaxID=2763059 RepID=A0ABR7HVZ9_9FIRM|nr:2Fe-2S iron-sulfur cluster-binding protein [Pseudoflavonifractor hominis]MBC5731698.1 2Fe-2S iron-sulfur cluster binding domain-containing protein [Pseudoflavonifractor hominis]
MLRVNPTESSILDQLRVQGILLESPCNGKGVCGKCKVRILRGNAGPLTETERSFLTMEEIEQGIRLACMAVPVEPVDLDPLELLKTEHTQVLGSSAMPAVSLQGSYRAACTKGQRVERELACRDNLTAREAAGPYPAAQPCISAGGYRSGGRLLFGETRGPDPEDSALGDGGRPGNHYGIGLSGGSAYRARSV